MKKLELTLSLPEKAIFFGKRGFKIFKALSRAARHRI